MVKQQEEVIAMPSLKERMNLFSKNASKSSGSASAGPRSQMRKMSSNKQVNLPTPMSASNKPKRLSMPAATGRRTMMEEYAAASSYSNRGRRTINAADNNANSAATSNNNNTTNDDDDDGFGNTDGFGASTSMGFGASASDGFGTADGVDDDGFGGVNGIHHNSNNDDDDGFAPATDENDMNGSFSRPDVYFEGEDEEDDSSDDYFDDDDDDSDPFGNNDDDRPQSVRDAEEQEARDGLHTLLQKELGTSEKAASSYGGARVQYIKAVDQLRPEAYSVEHALQEAPGRSKRAARQQLKQQRQAAAEKKGRFDELRGAWTKYDDVAQDKFGRRNAIGGGGGGGSSSTGTASTATASFDDEWEMDHDLDDLEDEIHGDWADFCDKVQETNNAFNAFSVVGDLAKGGAAADAQAEPLDEDSDIFDSDLELWKEESKKLKADASALKKRRERRDKKRRQVMERQKSVSALNKDGSGGKKKKGKKSKDGTGKKERPKRGTSKRRLSITKEEEEEENPAAATAAAEATAKEEPKTAAAAPQLEAPPPEKPAEKEETTPQQPPPPKKEKKGPKRGQSKRKLSVRNLEVNDAEKATAASKEPELPVAQEEAPAEPKVAEKAAPAPPAAPETPDGDNDSEYTEEEVIEEEEVDDREAQAKKDEKEKTPSKKQSASRPDTSDGEEDEEKSKARDNSSRGGEDDPSEALQQQQSADEEAKAAKKREKLLKKKTSSRSLKSGNSGKRSTKKKERRASLNNVPSSGGGGDDDSDPWANSKSVNGFTVWSNPPKTWKEDTNKIIVKVPVKTDCWRKTRHNFIMDNAPFYWHKVSGDFEVLVHVTTNFKNVYDKAGIMIRYDAENWMATALEQFNNTLNHSTLVTRDYTDWSVCPLPKQEDGKTGSWLCIKRIQNTFETFYSLNGSVWVQTRQGLFHDAESVRVGIFCASPMGGPGQQPTVEFDLYTCKKAVASPTMNFRS